VWHARGPGSAPGEVGRGVWTAVSRDDGETFAVEVPAGSQEDGACGCCALAAFADGTGGLYVLYRTARELEHRDIHLLVSSDAGESFRETLVDAWTVAACPMSRMSFAVGPDAVYGAWQTGEQVYLGPIDAAAAEAVERLPAPGTPTRRKYPALARTPDGRTLFAWSENAGWKASGSLAWQVFDASGTPVGAAQKGPALPEWSFGAAVSVNGDFLLIY